MCLSILAALYNKTKIEADSIYHKLIQESREIYFAKPRKEIKVIPHISHRCWLTSADEPYEAPKDRLEYYVQSCQILNEAHGDWQHYFWCLDPNKIPETVQFLRDANAGIEICTINDLYPKMRAKHIFDALLNEKLFTKASNIARLAMVHIYGGIYCDIGIELRPSLAPLIDCYESVWWLWANGLDQCIVGGTKNNPITSAFFDTFDHLHEMPDKIKTLKTGPHQMDWISGRFLHALILQFGASIKTLFVLSGTFAVAHNMNSWGGRDGNDKPLFGAKTLKEFSLDLFSIQPEEKRFVCLGQKYANKR